jgi:hypothetical protein
MDGTRGLGPASHVWGQALVRNRHDFVTEV